MKLLLIENNDFKSKQELDKIENKDMTINRIYGIYIDDFRKFKNEELDLGTNMTIIFGRNGTLKSTLMGLIAQPFRTDYTDIFSKPMQTKFSNVFNLSKTKDTRRYNYRIFMNIDNNDHLVEPIPLYPEKSLTHKILHDFVWFLAGGKQVMGIFRCHLYIQN